MDSSREQEPTLFRTVRAIVAEALMNNVG